jgi:predicted nucleic acid-binding protein
VAIYFVDTSAVIKRYVQEPGTAWIRNLADPVTGHFLYVARITDVEMTAALARCRAVGPDPDRASTALAQFRKDFAQDYRVVEITAPLLQRASLLAKAHGLRAYDAVQLSAALVIHSQDPSVIFVSADADLNAAAAAEGLQAEDPTVHP